MEQDLTACCEQVVVRRVVGLEGGHDQTGDQEVVFDVSLQELLDGLGQELVGRSP